MPDTATALVDGRYRLMDRIGAGATAVVWRAHDERLRRNVALKLYDGADPAHHRAELEILARVTHPGLVSVYDAGSHPAADGPDGPSRAFLVLELLAEGTLRDRVAECPLAPGRAASVGSAVAQALAHLHAHGVVHRDVKPANILLTGPGAPLAAKLADLGVAGRGDDRLPPGYTVGTARYLSPEQLRGRPAGPGSDAYALGLTLLEALTGAPAYADSVAPADLDRRPALPRWLDPAWQALLAALTEHDPSRRPTLAAAGAMLAALAEGVS